MSYQANPQGSFNCRLDGTVISMSPGAGLLGAPIDPALVRVHSGRDADSEVVHGLRIFGTGSTQRCRGDLAVVVLEQELGQDIAPVRFGRNVTLGEELLAVGYGDTFDPSVTGRSRRRGSSARHR